MSTNQGRFALALSLVCAWALTGCAPAPSTEPTAEAIAADTAVSAGGFGDHGVYTASLVASTDVTTRVVRRLAPAHEDQDFGRGDLLYAADAVERAWAPLAEWVLQR